MFFKICDRSLGNFPFHYRHNDLYINLDHGWATTYDNHKNILFYKGYIDNGDIKDRILDIANQEEPKLTGNFCLIKCFDQGVTVKTDRYRSFPIWYVDSSITNLSNHGNSIHTDSFVMITNNFEKIESKFKLFENKKIQKNLSFHDCVEKINLILLEKLTNFFKYNKLPIHVFLSGGIDTTTLYSYILKLKIPHVLINYLHTDLDYFYLKNHHTLSNFWGFRQIHYWAKPCLLLSGAPGDEFTIRSPTTANMILRYYNTSIGEHLDNFKDSLHYEYFLRYLKLFESQNNLNFVSLEHVVDECMDIILNDYQHWHLGHTLCYTPFRDIDIFTTIASLDKENLLGQIFHSTVQKELIKKNAPHLLNCLSNSKNTDNSFENLTNILPLDKYYQI